MPPAMSRTLEICEPMWKCSSLQRVREPAALSCVDQIEQLARRQAELGLVAAGVLPLAGAETGQPHAHAEQRFDAERARFFEHVLRVRTASR